MEVSINNKINSLFENLDSIRNKIEKNTEPKKPNFRFEYPTYPKLYNEEKPYFFHVRFFLVVYVLLLIIHFILLKDYKFIVQCFSSLFFAFILLLLYYLKNCSDYRHFGKEDEKRLIEYNSKISLYNDERKEYNNQMRMFNIIKQNNEEYTIEILKIEREIFDIVKSEIENKRLKLNEADDIKKKLHFSSFFENIDLAKAKSTNTMKNGKKIINPTPKQQTDSYVFCPNCGNKFINEKSINGKITGGLSGAASGAILGGKIGLALGPLGAISGTIPGAIIGGVFGHGIGDKFDKPICPKCNTKFNISNF